MLEPAAYTVAFLALLLVGRRLCDWIAAPESPAEVAGRPSSAGSSASGSPRSGSLHLGDARALQDKRSAGGGGLHPGLVAAGLHRPNGVGGPTPGLQARLRALLVASPAPQQRAPAFSAWAFAAAFAASVALLAMPLVEVAALGSPGWRRRAWRGSVSTLETLLDVGLPAIGALVIVGVGAGVGGHVQGWAAGWAASRPRGVPSPPGTRGRSPSGSLLGPAAAGVSRGRPLPSAAVASRARKRLLVALLVAVCASTALWRLGGAAAGAAEREAILAAEAAEARAQQALRAAGATQARALGAAGTASAGAAALGGDRADRLGDALFGKAVARRRQGAPPARPPPPPAEAKASSSSSSSPAPGALAGLFSSSGLPSASSPSLARRLLGALFRPVLFSTSTLALRALARSGALGIFVVAALSGYGSAALPYDCLSRFARPVEAAEVAALGAQVDRAAAAVATKEAALRELEGPRVVPGGGGSVDLALEEGAAGGSGFLSSAFGGAGAPVTPAPSLAAASGARGALAAARAALFGRGRSSRAAALTAELQQQRRLLAALRDDLAAAKAARARALQARTPLGRLRNAAGWLLSAYCLYRMMAAAGSLLLRPRGAPPAGDALARAAGAALARAGVDVDPERAAQGVTLLFVACVSGASIRGLLAQARGLAAGKGAGAAAALRALLVAELLGHVAAATLLLLAGQLSERHRAALAGALGGDLPVSAFRRDFDAVFLVAASSTVALLYAKVRAKRREESDRLPIYVGQTFW